MSEKILKSSISVLMHSITFEITKASPMTIRSSIRMKPFLSWHENHAAQCNSPHLLQKFGFSGIAVNRKLKEALLHVDKIEQWLLSLHERGDAIGGSKGEHSV